MSVLMEFAIFPTDKGESVSRYVAPVIKMIKEECASYTTSPMGTTIETDTMEEALEILRKANKILETDCKRIYIAAKFDIRKGGNNRITQKIESLNKELNKL